jgi:hypothetical protein
LAAAVSAIKAGAAMQKMSSHIAYAAYEEILDKSLWRARFSSTTDFEKSVSAEFGDGWNRKKRIEMMWEVDLAYFFGDMAPTKWSKHLVERLLRLAKTGCTAKEARELLQSQFLLRLNTAGVSKDRRIQAADVLRILEARLPSGNSIPKCPDPAKRPGKGLIDSQSPCRCDASIRRALTRLESQPQDDIKGLAMLKSLQTIIIGGRICHVHARSLSTRTVALNNSQSGCTAHELNKRMILVAKCPCVSGLEEFRRKHPSWFRNSSLLECNVNVWIHSIVPETQFTFDGKAILERWAKCGQYDSWLNDGTVVLAGFFNWFLEAPGVMGHVEDEFNMYR